ncbi:uroporphyrinogen decarboxylase family protein [Actomonas aquatica]|uniref:Uroporphyrinogen decarboxylase family protein n=1 Tax=Actomonas aquatica TaxID=2866162 RepID=A0ABZ1C6M5_9BACT|nr:uroporphyrinogen decarboxylase family protein [Opitutus sp. WL0086]WRQ87374.1 uroporphyrinogen decarboxylase family protein [Opitutus sp. WL0086]
MITDTFLNLAREGHCMPIGTHLVLHEQPDPEAILLDGKRLGSVVAQTAVRFATPLAVPLMDLTVEKEALLLACKVPAEEVGAYHFTELPALPADIPPTPRMLATCQAIEYIAQETDLLPMGMCIGPYSLLTKLVRDPITPVFMSGMGMTGEDEPDIALIDALLIWSERMILDYVDAQIAAGAKAMIVCEPAANMVYFSPNQMEDNPRPFEFYVMEPMRRLADRLTARGVALVFHDCGELTDAMVERFATLEADMISLGSSRDLAHDASLLPKETVIFGNLPSKNFYATQLTTAEVEEMGRDLTARMQAIGHPFILGTECDVLSVPGKEAEIVSKVNALMRCACEQHAAGTGSRRAERVPTTNATVSEKQ